MMNKKNPAIKAYRELLAIRKRIARRANNITLKYKFKGAKPKPNWDLWELRAE